MAKIWVCDTGWYSDRYTTAVYSDEKTAREVSAAYGWNDPEPYELDPPVPPEIPQGLKRFNLWMYVDGSLRPGCGPKIADIGEDTFYEGPVWPDKKEMPMWRYFCWARDEQHAIKIANDRRIAWLADPTRGR
jgi:hypothetical protein